MLTTAGVVALNLVTFVAIGFCFGAGWCMAQRVCKGNS